MKKMPESLVDFHVHLFPDKGFDAIWKFFETMSQMEVRYKLYHMECIKYLNDQGVNPIVYSNYAHKKGIAEPMNEWNIQVLDEFSDLFCFTPYHPDDEQALAYTERMLAHPRVVGVKIHFEVQKFYPNDERLYPLYDHPNIYLDTAFTFWPDLPFSFNLGVETLEKYQDRILYGSDFPNVVLPREGEIEQLLAFDLSDDFYEKVFYKNGLNLLKQVCPDAFL